MTYAQGRTLYDADSHLLELPDFLQRYGDPGMRDQLPDIGFADRLDPLLQEGRIAGPVLILIV